MGYKLDFEVEKEYIDTWADGDIFQSAIKVSGSSVTDYIFLEQDGKTVAFTVSQFREMISKLKQSTVRFEVGLEE